MEYRQRETDNGWAKIATVIYDKYRIKRTPNQLKNNYNQRLKKKLESKDSIKSLEIPMNYLPTPAQSPMKKTEAHENSKETHHTFHSCSPMENHDNKFPMKKTETNENSKETHHTFQIEIHDNEFPMKKNETNENSKETHYFILPTPLYAYSSPTLSKVNKMDIKYIIINQS